MNDDTKLGLAALSLAVAIACYVLMCAGASQAVEHEVKYRNPGTTPYERLEVCHARTGGVPTCVELAAPCVGGATCTARIDLPHGESIVSARARVAALYSDPSNSLTRIAVEPAQCLSEATCRHDADGSGAVTVADFASFLGSLGRSWIP